MANIFLVFPVKKKVSQNIDNWISIAVTPDIFTEKDGNPENDQTKLLVRGWL